MNRASLIKKLRLHTVFILELLFFFLTISLFLFFDNIFIIIFSVLISSVCISFACFLFSTVFFLIRFYLFVGGILCVCSFFCSFFWGSLSKTSSSIYSYLFCGLLVYRAFEASKFSGTGFLEFGRLWAGFWAELILTGAFVLLAIVAMLLLLQNQSGGLRGYEI